VKVNDTKEEGMSPFAHRTVQDPAEWHRLHCSFCGRSDRRVRFLVAGKSGGMICNSCCLTAVFIFVKAYAASLLEKDSLSPRCDRASNDSGA